MILHRFYLQVIARILLLAATALIFTWSWTNLHHLFTFITFGVLFILQVVLLIFFINKINRDLSQFFVSLPQVSPPLRKKAYIKVCRKLCMKSCRA